MLMTALLRVPVLLLLLKQRKKKARSLPRKMAPVLDI